MSPIIKRHPPINRYVVTWVIDIEAATPKEAARKALDIQRNRVSIATVFFVNDEKGNTTEVDLLKEGGPHA